MRRDAAFRSGRLPDVNRAGHRARGSGNGNGNGNGGRREGKRATMDLGRFSRNSGGSSTAPRDFNSSSTSTGLNDGASGPAQVRTAGLGAFLRSIFSRSENHDTRPVQRDGLGNGHGRGTRRFGNFSGAINLHDTRAMGGRAAAASSLGSLQSYATSTIRSAPGGCLSPSSTSEVDVRKRVAIRRDESERLVFSSSDGQKLMSARAPRFEYPNFALAEYGGRETWNSDVFVLLHNAIRWEIMDVYNILGSMQRRWSSLQMIDIWDFAEHWEVFEVFVAQYFEIEDQIIFPFLLNVAASSGELARYHKVVKYNKDRLDGLLIDIGQTLERFNSASPAEIVPVLYEQLVNCLPKILDYMNEQEQVLPGVFMQHCDPQDRTLLNRACANFLVRATNGRHGIAILTRWIEDSMVLQMWKNENLSARAKQSHKKWIQALQSEHVDIANRFQRRMRNLQNEHPGIARVITNDDRKEGARSRNMGKGRRNLTEDSMAAALA